MRISELYEKEKIDNNLLRELMSEFGVTPNRYSINDDNSVSVRGDVKIPKYYDKIPIQFDEVTGSFYCFDMELKSLEGAPEKIGSNFYAQHSSLQTLHGGPVEVGESYIIHSNNLTSLEGAPKKVGYIFDCINNNLNNSLTGGPQKVGWHYRCSHNKLTTLEGAPKIIYGDFLCTNNELTTLEGAPQKVNGNFRFDDNPIKTLKGFPLYVGGEVSFFINTEIIDPYDFRYLLFSYIEKDIQFLEFSVQSSRNQKIEEIISNYKYDGTPESKRRVAQGIKLLKELSDAEK